MTPPAASVCFTFPQPFSVRRDGIYYGSHQVKTRSSKSNISSSYFPLCHQRHNDANANTTTATTNSALGPPARPRQQRRCRVYRTYHRLIGAPRLSPPLHVRVHAVYHPAADSDNPVLPARTPPRQSATSFDFVPRDATLAATTALLLAGAQVPGEVRIRRVSWPPRRGAPRVDCGWARAGVDAAAVVREWVLGAGGARKSAERGEEEVIVKALSLYRSNCWHFADEVVRVLLHGVPHERRRGD